MKDDEYIRWQSRIVELDDQQLLDLTRRIKLRQEAGLRSRESGDWLLKGICEALYDRGLLSDAAQMMLGKTKHFKTYERVAPVLRSELEPLCEQHLRPHLAYVVGLSLINLVDTMGFRVSPMLVFTNAARAREALENSFPGYISSGMLDLVLEDKRYDHASILRQQRRT